MGGTAHAALIEISSASFSPSGGYGTDSSETSSPTLLGVEFSTSIFTPQSFTLGNVNDFMTFNFGTVQLNEPNVGGGITSAETDDLGVMANFMFTSPLGASQAVNAIGNAMTGSVSDADVDYTLTWTPVIVNFDFGGSFEISLTSLSFSTQSIMTQQATIRLLSQPQTNIDPFRKRCSCPGHGGALWPGSSDPGVYVQAKAILNLGRF